VPKDKKLLLLNFDAHLDLRSPLVDGRGTSGSMFWQMAQLCEHSGRAFHYMCVGVQESANTLFLRQRAATLNVHEILASELGHDAGVELAIEQILQEIAAADFVYLSLCLDVLHESAMPGVSAPQPLGIEPRVLQRFLQHIATSPKIVACDVVELAPSLDPTMRSARLAAALVYEFIGNASGGVRCKTMQRTL
jgi:formiminoglutamase